MTVTEFSGFPQEGLHLLADLAQNNNKTWFTAHKKEYDRYILGTAVLFVAELGARLQSILPALRVDTRTNGSGNLMRIYRDTRFSQDKSPYKTSVAGMFWQGSGKKTGSPAFGFHLDSQGMQLMAGQFSFDAAQLRAYREAVVDEVLGPRLVKAATAVFQAGPYQIVGSHFKQTPRGFEAGDERSEWLLYNALYAHPVPPVSLDQVTSPQIVDICFDHFQRMAPIQQWLAQAITP